MLRMVNEYGNRIIYAKTENEKNRLLDKGFHIDAPIEEKPKETKPKTKKKVVKKSEGNED